MLTRQERERAGEAAKDIWEGLDHAQRGDLGDVMVLEGGRATYEWLEVPRLPGLLDALDALRLTWEMEMSA